MKLLVATEKHKVLPAGTPIAVLRDDQDQSLLDGIVMTLDLPGMTHQEGLEICGYANVSKPGQRGSVNLKAIQANEGRASRSFSAVWQHIKKPE